MTKRLPLDDPRLSSLLSDLLALEQLPALDRWFSVRAKKARWSPADQKTLWDGLRRALTRALDLVPDAQTPEGTAWPGLRRGLQDRAREWSLRAALPAPEVPGVCSAGIPGWLAPSWESRADRSKWDAGARTKFLRSQELPAPVYLRYRPDPTGQECARKHRSAGLSAPSEVDGIDCLVGDRGLEGTPEWTQGLVEIQDASSQLSLRRFGLRPGMRVWDVCAGRGGKTLLAAQELRGKGMVVATDVAEFKLKILKDRVRRSGLQNVRILGWDGQRLPEWGPEANRGFDRVIVDAPCTASGTWRRDPEARFRLTPRVITELTGHQARLLRLGWEALRSGGLLAYITCSWLPEENEAIVNTFLEENPGSLVHHEGLGLPWFDANTLFVSILEKP